MPALAQAALRSGLALLVIGIGGCAAPDRLVSPDGTADGIMLSGEPTPLFRITGGGRIDDTEGMLKNEFFEPGHCEGKSFATFGFNAGPGRDGEPRGSLEWVDHCRGFRIHGDDVTLFRTISGTGDPHDRGCAVWEGPARLNGQAGFLYRIGPACDEGEPGRRSLRDPDDPPDWIAIELIDADGVVVYLRHGALTGGNIQTHRVR